MFARPNSSEALFDQVQILKRKANLLQKEISCVEATVSQVVTSYEDKIAELGNLVHPYSDSGEAICNWYSERSSISDKFV